MMSMYVDSAAKALFDVLNDANTADALDATTKFCSANEGLSEAVSEVAESMKLTDGNYTVADAIWKLAECVEDVATAIDRLGGR